MLKRIMGNTLKLLGTGGSTGVPVVGCKCAVCLSQNKNNKRLRSGGVFRINGKNILMDAGPDIRQQTLLHGIDHVDGIFLSHYHEDHMGGMNDLRGFFFEREMKPIPVYLSENTYDMITVRFGYLLDRFEFIKINDHFGSFDFLGETFSYHAYEQGSVPVLGFRYKKAAYLTDIKTYEETIFDFLDGVDSLVVSSLHEDGGHMHFSFEEAEAFAKKAKIKNTYLIHMNHLVEHEHVTKNLIQGMSLATDGMEIDV